MDTVAVSTSLTGPQTAILSKDSRQSSACSTIDSASEVHDAHKKRSAATAFLGPDDENDNQYQDLKKHDVHQLYREKGIVDNAIKHTDNRLERFEAAGVKLRTKKEMVDNEIKNTDDGLEVFEAAAAKLRTKKARLSTRQSSIERCILERSQDM